MQAIQEIGLMRVWKFFYLTLLMALFQICLFPNIRKWFLQLLGAKVGSNVVLHRVRFFNYDRMGFRGLRLGNNVFIGDECLLDLADKIELEDHVTLAERVTILTHMNVGFKNHPLQASYPKKTAPIRIQKGSFVGACSTILAGVQIGEKVLVAAGSVVNRSISSETVVGGVPAREIKEIPAI